MGLLKQGPLTPRWGHTQFKIWANFYFIISGKYPTDVFQPSTFTSKIFYFFILAKIFSFVMNFRMAFLIVFIGTEGCRYFVSCRSSEITRYRYVLLCVYGHEKQMKQARGKSQNMRELEIERRAANRLSCWHVWMSLVIRVLAYGT